MVENLPSIAGNVSSILGWGAKIPCAARDSQKTKKIKTVCAAVDSVHDYRCIFCASQWVSFLISLKGVCLGFLFCTLPTEKPFGPDRACLPV